MTLRRHILKRKPLKRKKFKPLTEEERDEILKMKEFFLLIWIKKPHISEISGEKIFSPPSSANFHHIILKENCEQGKYDEDNIILLTIDEHTQVHTDMYRYEEINRRRRLLKIKYGIDD